MSYNACGSLQQRAGLRLNSGKIPQGEQAQSQENKPASIEKKERIDW